MQRVNPNHRSSSSKDDGQNGKNFGIELKFVNI